MLQEHEKLKRNLKASSEKHRQNLEKEIQDLSKSAKKNSKNLLLIGGGLIIGYQLFKVLFEKRNGEHPSKNKKADAPSPTGPTVGNRFTNSIKNEVMQMVTDQAALYLLSVVKKKLQEFLEKKQGDENTPL